MEDISIPMICWRKMNLSLTFGKGVVAVFVLLKSSAFSGDLASFSYERDLAGFCLVGAKVISTKTTSAGHGAAVARVSVVYFGGGEWQGNEFPVEYCLAEGDEWDDYEVWPPLRVGDEGIWMLFKERNGSLSVKYRNHRGHDFIPGLLWPVIKRDKQRYESGEALAEYVFKVLNVEDEDRQIAILLDATSSEYVAVCIWSTQWISRVDSNAGRGALERVLSDVGNLPVEAQIYMDRTMSRLRGDGWRKSKRRLDMIRSWSNIVMSDVNRVNSIIVRVGHRYQDRDLSPRQFVDLVIALSKNKSIPSESRAFAVGSPSPFIGRWDGIDQELYLAFLMDTIRDVSSDKNVRVSAAIAIGEILERDDLTGNVRRFDEMSRMYEEEKDDRLRSVMKRIVMRRKR